MSSNMLRSLIADQLSKRPGTAMMMQGSHAPQKPSTLSPSASRLKNVLSRMYETKTRIHNIKG